MPRASRRVRFAAFAVGLLLSLSGAGTALAASASHATPRWWSKYETLLHGASSPALSSPLSTGANIDASNEDTPQSETAITVNPSNSSQVVGGSNEIVRLPMRAYYSTDGGASFGADDLPLPAPITTNGTDFGSDPGVAFDTRGNVYYSYIVVFFNRSFGGVQGSEMAVAKSSDGGRTWPQVSYFNFTTGSSRFNDKPMIAVDTNPASPYRDSVYVAWDSASNGSGKSSANDALYFARSTDGGASFSAPTVLNSLGSGASSVIGADPFVGPGGEVYVAWHDIVANRLMMNRSLNGGATFGQPVAIAPTAAPYDIGIPAMATRRALVYPACDADRSGGTHSGTLYCSWMDQTPSNGTDIFVARSTDSGRSWASPQRVNDDPAGVAKDQFNQWLAVDPTSGAVGLSWNDARNDPADTKTDIYTTRSTDGGASFAANSRVTTAMTDESAANPAANASDQYGDYEGIAAYGGAAHPIWTDGRLDATVDPATGATFAEEVFTAVVRRTR